MPLVSQTFDQLLDFTRTTSGTFVGSNGLIQNTPASVNLLTWTQQFDNAAWGIGATTVTANATVAPDGTSTADKVIATAVAGYHVKNQLVTVTSGVSYTLSFYVKAAEYTKVYFCDAQSGKYACSFDLAAVTAGTPTGSYTGKSASIESAGNGWYRCELQFIPTATEASRPSATGYPDTGATLTNFGAQYTGDGTSGIFAWGAQLEAVPATNLVLGSELVTNGTFAGGSTTGWTAGGSATLSGTGDVLTITNGATAFGYAVTPITTIVGRRYYVTYQVTGGTNNGALYIGTASGGFEIYNGPGVGVGSYAVSFVATTTTTYLRLGPLVNTSGATFIVDNISTKEITAITGMPSTYTRNNGGRFPPRFDYDPVTLAAKGLLTEEQRTNLQTYSEQLDNAGWVKTAITVTANATTSPDGTVDADKVVPDTTSAVHRISLSNSVTSGVAYAFSVFVKASGYSKVGIREGNFSAAYATFDLSTGTKLDQGSGGVGSITPLNNGWYRIDMVSTSGGTSMRPDIIVLDPAYTTGAPTGAWAGNGTDGIFAWGSQLEAGAFATSYIPTVASQVTRTADQCSIVAPNFAPWYNQSEGTFVAEFTVSQPISAGSGIFDASTGSANDEIFGYYNTTQTLARVAVGGVQQASMALAGVSVGNTYKLAAAYKANDFASSLSGGTVVTDTSGTVPTVNQLAVGSRATVAAFLNGHIRSIRYYPTRLTNAQLQALTA